MQLIGCLENRALPVEMRTRELAMARRGGEAMRRGAQ
jgi:hypothetical protein